MENIKNRIHLKLRELIDSELEKEEPDTELIGECVDGILRLMPERSYQLTAEQRKNNIHHILNETPGRRFRSKAVRILVAAAIIAALLIGSTLADTIVEYEIYDYDTYSIVQSNITTRKIDEPIVVSYVPEGFVLTQEDCQEFTSSKVYEKGGKCLAISKDSFDSVEINTEYGKAKVFTIDGIDYILYGEEVHGKGVVWFSGHYSYSLTAALSDEELLKIAQSVS